MSKWSFKTPKETAAHRHRLPRTWFRPEGTEATCRVCGERYKLIGRTHDDGRSYTWQYKDTLQDFEMMEL